MPSKEERVLETHTHMPSKEERVESMRKVSESEMLVACSNERLPKRCDSASLVELHAARPHMRP